MSMSGDQILIREIRYRAFASTVQPLFKQVSAFEVYLGRRDRIPSLPHPLAKLIKYRTQNRQSEKACECTRKQSLEECFSHPQ